MASATERLRAMLDERGVEWWQSANTLGCIFTRWHSPLFGDEVCAMENGEEGLVLFDHFLNPEQVIAATLGARTCHKLPASGEKTCVVRHNSTHLTMEFGYWKCSECGCECFEGARYCMKCGARAVDA